jgi:hypothetical protein
VHNWLLLKNGSSPWSSFLVGKLNIKKTLGIRRSKLDDSNTSKVGLRIEGVKTWPRLCSFRAGCISTFVYLTTLYILEIVGRRIASLLMTNELKKRGRKCS